MSLSHKPLVSPSRKTLQSLYSDLQDTLSHTETSMQDTALDIIIEIEATIKAVLEQEGNKYTIDPRRSKRYGLSAPHDQDLSPREVFYQQLASEAQVMRQAVGRGLSTQHLLSQITRIRSRIRIALQDHSPLDIIQELGILHHIHQDGGDKPFAPTMLSEGIQVGSGRGYEKVRETAPKFQAVLQLLLTIDTPEGGHIDPRDLIIDLQMNTPDTMMREIPYIVIRIPRLNRTILINDVIGEATFILMGLTDLGDIRSYHKHELQTILSAQRIEYNDTYETRLSSYLLSDWEIYTPDDFKDDSHNFKNSHDRIEHPITDSNTIKPRATLNNHLLFLDHDTIQRDLTSFLQEAKTKNSLTDLSTSNPSQNANITLSNGQEIAWRAYLNQASGILLGTKEKSNNPHRSGEVLTLLLKKVGVPILDTDYFSEANKEGIRKDLMSFLQEVKIEKSLVDLSITNPLQDTKIILSNGQEMSWQTYLKQASGILLGTKEKSNNPHRQAEALTKLCEMVGVKRKVRAEQAELSANYFSEANKEGIRKDLMNFLQKGKINNSLADLNTTNPLQDTKIILSNGQEIAWRAYLNQTSTLLLGTKYGSDNPHRQAEVLTLLLKRIGVQILDANYFSEANKETIQQDLTNFLQEAKIKNSLADLSTGNPPQNAKIILFNGQNITWGIYLNQASGILLGTKKRSDNPHSPAEALTRLCEIVGVKRTERVQLDTNYFSESNKLVIEQDLTSFLQKAKTKNSLADLSTSNPLQKTRITLSNIQEITWEAYLNQASSMLLGTKERSDNPHRKGDALTRLCEIVGVKRKR